MCTSGRPGRAVRPSLRILIPESQAMGSVACIRSLGQAGHTVIAMAHTPQAQGFKSSFCHERLLLSPGLKGRAFGDWLAEVVQTYRVDLILPSEGLVHALGSEVARFADLLPVGPDVHRIERFVSKFELFSHFLGANDVALHEHVPKLLLMKDVPPSSDALEVMRLPIFAKFDARPDSGLGAAVHRFDTYAQAVKALPDLLRSYGRGVLQQFSPGQGVGVFFLRWDGRILASLMHRRLHEVPHTGGVSSLRETWWNQPLYDDARRRIESLDWWGVGMLEYRWDAKSGAFELMEFNARFWGSLHLALFAGVDFPLLLADAWSGQAVTPVSAKLGVQCRYTFPKDVEHLWSVLSDRHVGVWEKSRQCVRFLALGLDPRVHSDLWFPGDRGLYWRALRDTPGKFLR